MVDNYSNSEELLSSGSITRIRLSSVGSNYTFFVNLEDGHGASAVAIYKPLVGEAPLWDFPQGTLFRRECASYLLCEALGWGFVPATVIRDGPYGIGSVQLYIDHLTNQHYFTLRDDYPVDLLKVCLFDIVTNNADRKASHLLLDRNGHVWAIDHGLTFHDEMKLRTVIWDFAGVSIPRDLIRDVGNLSTRFDDEGDSFVKSITQLISVEELTALRDRLRLLLETEVYPAPDISRRNIPWPLF